MKTNFTVLLSIFIFIGCTTPGALVTFKPASTITAVEGKTEFVELKDGTIVDGTIEKLEWRGEMPLIYSSKFTVNGTPYRGKEINAIQSRGRYFRKTVYNDFAERIIKGKVNVYKLQKQTPMNDKGRITTYYLHYLQKGEGAPLNEYDNKLMEKTIGDNAAAMAKFNEYKRLSGKEKNRQGAQYLSEVIDIYNQ